MSMALETIAKLVIVLVVITVCVGLIITFSSQIKTSITEFLFPGQNEVGCNTEQIEAASFSADDIKKAGTDCWDCGKEASTDIICYIMIITSDNQFPSKDSIENKLSDIPFVLESAGNQEYDPSSETLIIRYSESRGLVIIETS